MQDQPIDAFGIGRGRERSAVGIEVALCREEIRHVQDVVAIDPPDRDRCVAQDLFQKFSIKALLMILSR